ncbi:MAG: ABC transporter ATP-binding protein [Actinobacteria bacterium]|nr:ABC transporter ATP-binding protein [Actinomycetota bacterium]MBU1942613.1 ABC transporter ATP-binding protein [Actinomycetota bacterium]MBU2688711.1 ABC transporter ATP-binding protein [Actinomycetota bacterium]
MSDTAFELIDVQKVYHRGSEEVRAVDGLSLSVPAGEYLSITGPSGSGKSTLLNLIGCVDTPTAGLVRVDGLEVAGMKENELRRIRSKRIGFVFQQFFLLPTLTALENVMVPGVFYEGPNGSLRARAEGLLQTVGLGKRVAHRPSELSGGEMQRVAIARSLVNRPSILLADEPTGNLDIRNSGEIVELLEGFNAEGLTLIVVTHNPELAARAGRGISLADGRIA